jgi:hypothetical protein
MLKFVFLSCRVTDRVFLVCVSADSREARPNVDRKSATFMHGRTLHIKTMALHMSKSKCDNERGRFSCCLWRPCYWISKPRASGGRPRWRRVHDMLRGRKQLQTIAERSIGVERDMCGCGWLRLALQQQQRPCVWDAHAAPLWSSRGSCYGAEAERVRFRVL